MDARTSPILFLLLTSVVIDAWQSADDYIDRGLRRGMHFHSKRHMILRENERKRRITTQKPKEYRRKPSGNLRPIHEDEMEDSEVVSVAVGPPLRTKYDKIYKQSPKSTERVNNYATNNTAASLVKDVLAQLGRELLTREVNEDFVFGQYVGISLRNLTQTLKLRVQHDILDIIVKYQRLNQGDASLEIKQQIEERTSLPLPLLKDTKIEKKPLNDTDEGWPDFKNLAKIVG